MKHFYHITAMILLATALLCGCDSAVEKTCLPGASSFVAPALQTMADVTINSDNNKVESVTFNWSGASFGVPTQVEYDLYLSANGNTALAGMTYSTAYTITKNDLNGLVVNDLGIKANESAKIEAYVVAGIYGTDAVETVKSNSVTFSVQTFKAALRCYYVCGEFQSWTIGEAPMFWETDGGTNIYKALIDFDNSTNPDRTDDTYSYFKITAERDWSHDNWGYNDLTPSWSCPEQKDSNLSIPVAEGTKNLITVNVGKMTISREVVTSVGAIGSFTESGNWDHDALFVYDPVANVWKCDVTFASDSEFLIRLNGSWDCKYGDGIEKSDIVEDGYKLTQSSSAANIKAPGEGSYTILLYANMTPFVVAYQSR